MTGWIRGGRGLLAFAGPALVCLAAAFPSTASAKVGYGDAYLDCQLFYPHSWVWVRPPSGIPAVDHKPRVRETQELRVAVELFYADPYSLDYRSAGGTSYLSTTVAEGGWVKVRRKRKKRKRRRRYVPGQVSTANWSAVDGVPKRYAFEWDTVFDVSTYARLSLAWYEDGQVIYEEANKIPALNYQTASGNRFRESECYQYNPYGSGTGHPIPFGGRVVYFP